MNPAGPFADCSVRVARHGKTFPRKAPGAGLGRLVLFLVLFFAAAKQGRRNECGTDIAKLQ